MYFHVQLVVSATPRTHALEAVKKTETIASISVTCGGVSSYSLFPRTLTSHTHSPTRTDADGELYAYLPISKRNSRAMMRVPETIADDDFGYSVGRGAFELPTNEWISIAQRVKLNDPPCAFNGEVELFIDGESTLLLKKVRIRTTEEAAIMGFHFITFFGGTSGALSFAFDYEADFIMKGGDATWSSPKDQRAYFADISAAIIV